MVLPLWEIHLLFILRRRALTNRNISAILTFILNKHLLNIAACFQIDPEKKIALKTMHSSPSAILASTSLLISAVAYSLWGILLNHNPVSKATVYGWCSALCSSRSKTKPLPSGVHLSDSGVYRHLRCQSGFLKKENRIIILGGNYLWIS